MLSLVSLGIPSLEAVSFPQRLEGVHLYTGETRGTGKFVVVHFRQTRRDHCPQNDYTDLLLDSLTAVQK